MKLDLSKFAYSENIEKTELKTRKLKRPYEFHKSELKYKHLSQLPELLRADLQLVFVGYNPSVRSAEAGHRFAHPTNTFWKLLNESGIIEENVILTYKDDELMPEKFNIGFTDLVLRPSKGIEELSALELKRNVPRLMNSLNKYQPKIVCFVGKGIWENVSKTMISSGLMKKSEFKWGLQEQKFYKGSIFVVPSTSGLVRISWEEKLQIWKELAKIVKNT